MLETANSAYFLPVFEGNKGCKITVIVRNLLGGLHLNLMQRSTHWLREVCGRLQLLEQGKESQLCSVRLAGDN